MNRVLLLALFLGFAVPGWATTYYVAPSPASGTTCSSGTPCAPNYAIAHAVGDDIINMQNGTYTGDNYMLTIVSRSGSSGHPITVQAINDGLVLIDGQSARTPINVNASSWWEIKGMNAKRGGGGNDFNVGVYAVSSNINIRRVGCWDAPDTNSACFWVFNADTVLLEDTFAFGIGRKTYSNNQGGNHVTIRRAWCDWNKSTYSDGSATYCYSNAYNSFNAIFENVIGTRNEDSGTVLGADSGILGQDREDTTPCATAQYLGSIGYIKSSDTAHLESLLKGGQFVDCNTDTNVVTYDGTNTIQLVELANLNASAPWNGPSTHHFYNNGTEIGTGGALVQSDWTVTNRSTGSTVGAVPNIWNGGGSSGARVCFQYVNGTLGSTPLWPWPMNQRIIDAMTTAGRTPVDVTATMNSIFGTIPAGCGGVSPPDNLVFSSQPTSVISGNNFSPDITVTANLSGGGTDTGFTGNVTLAINGCGASVTGTTTRAAVSGVATFITLGATTFTSGCAFTASATGTNSVVSNTFNVICAATKLAFTFQPSNAQIGASLGKVAVAIENAGGMICTDNTSIVTIANKGGSCIGMVLGGNAINNAVSGVFTTLNLSESGAGSCILHATDGALTAADSNLFNISSHVPGPSGRIRTH